MKPTRLQPGCPVAPRRDPPDPARTAGALVAGPGGKVIVAPQTAILQQTGDLP